MQDLEQRSRSLFDDSVAGLGAGTRSRLTQARHAALAAAERTARRPWFFRMPLLTPALGVVAAVVVAMGLWMSAPMNSPAVAENPTSLDDLEIVAASDGSSGDAIEMLQDDLDFYDWADKTANQGPSA